MASVYSKSLQIYNAEQFKASIDLSTEPYMYLTFGKVVSWPNENSPAQANTSVLAYNELWRNMLGAKKIEGGDVRLGIYRHNWTANTVYNAYDDCACSLSLNDANNKFYILTDDWNIFKCISNNNGGISTFKPTSTITNSAVETPDKYIWKYMYSLTDEDRLRFTTDKYIPVKTLKDDNGSLQWQVQSSAIPGSIEAINVTNGGSGYTTPPDVLIVGDGSEAEAIARINTETTAVESIVISNKGLNYTFGNVVITSTSGSGANARIVISPTNGHGSDPVQELGASNIILNARVRGTEGDILDVANEIRQVALMTNIRLKSTGNLASNLAYSQTMSLIMDQGTSEYQEDEIVYQGASVETATFVGTVASWNPAENRLELIDISGNPGTDILTGTNTRTARFVRFVIEQDLRPYSGSLLYINNVAPIQRAEDQTEDFKIILSF
jgi:hypothetical protein